MGMAKEYIDKMDAQLKKWDADVEQLALEGKKVGVEVRSAYYERIRALRVGRNAALKTFRDCRAATVSASAEMQAGMDLAWDSMRQALEKASAELRK